LSICPEHAEGQKLFNIDQRMKIIKRLFRFFAEYFVFVAGIIFAFVLGLVYAIFNPKGIVINMAFLLIIFGWLAYLIKNFWDLMEKRKKTP